jgi:hypothetical protein
MEFSVAEDVLFQTHFFCRSAIVWRPEPECTARELDTPEGVFAYSLDSSEHGVFIAGAEGLLVEWSGSAGD